MLLTSCLAAALVCFLATADDVTPSIENGDMGMKRSIEDLEEIETHHRAKRTLSYGSNFVGTGYDYLRGNPEGGRSSQGGIDPGIKATRRHLKLSATVCSSGHPKELEVVSHSSCVTHSSNMVYHGTRSYQSNLNIDASVSASGRYGLASYAFSMSARYQQAKAETTNTKNVMLDVRQVCNRGRIRVKKELAQSLSFSVDDSFAAAVCKLPTLYNRLVYMKFLEDWGTHTITETELGTKTVNRKRSSLSELFRSAMTNTEAAVSASGSYLSYSASLSLNMALFQSSSSFTSNFKESLYNFTLGTNTHPEPIGFKLDPIVAMLDNTYWRDLNGFIRRKICPTGSTYTNKISIIRTNLETALRGYPAYLQARPSADNPLKIPLVWPYGTYSLVQPRSGCPTSPAPGTLFHEGYRRHDTEDSNPQNSWTSGLQLKGSFAKNDLTWYFCSKTVASFTEYDIGWGAGKYCIVKKGACPTGFQEGSLKWDDEDSNNRNSVSGILPEGSYYRDTVMKFCCRSDGFVENAIFLPRNKPFILMMKTDTCQKVHGMHVQKQFVRWDDEDSNNIDYRRGAHPYDIGGSKDHRLGFCYYTRA